MSYDMQLSIFEFQRVQDRVRSGKCPTNEQRKGWDFKGLLSWCYQNFPQEALVVDVYSSMNKERRNWRGRGGEAKSLIFHVEWSSMKKDYFYYNFSIVT